ncbi:MAG TPA: hypothetical protein VNN77_02670 [candidate division Zixibacteria bacterium]|nr:hypothetical protein [candidate division Zixibacteria bacterium]
MKTKALLGAAILAIGVQSQAGADTTATLNTEAARMNTLAAHRGESNVVGKISNDFSSFLGADAPTVVSGLRNGTPIILTSTVPGPTPGTTTLSQTIINPPTGKMGFGNVYISLALAKQQLSQMGITQPTPEQLQAALTGGTITVGSGPTATTQTLDGILTLRSQNMGWGQIAQKLGFKLGPVISGMKSANQNLASAATTTSNTTGAAAATAGKPHGKSQSGIVSAGGKPQGGTNVGAGKKSSGEGIVSASGRPGGGNAYGHGKGIVTGSGSAVGGGVVSAGGHGNSANAKGHNK